MGALLDRIQTEIVKWKYHSFSLYTTMRTWGVNEKNNSLIDVWENDHSRSTTAIYPLEIKMGRRTLKNNNIPLPMQCKLHRSTSISQ